MTKPQIKDIGNCQFEIKAEIEASVFDDYRKQALTELSTKTKIEGFRPGKAPTKIVATKIGEDKILTEAAEMAIRQFYLKTITEEKLDVIGQPEITVTKMAPDNPLCFTIKISVVPEIKLPDYKKIIDQAPAIDETKLKVSDDEITNALKEIAKELEIRRSHKEKREPNLDKLPDLTEADLPELGKFSSLVDFKEVISQNLNERKKLEAKEKRRLEILETITNQANLNPPLPLVDRELEKMLAELRSQVESMGLKFEDYLSHLKKTEAELKTAWQKDAVKRVSFGLIINAIADEEKITIADEVLEKEVANIINQNQQTKIDKERAKAYVQNMLTNQKVLELLDKNN